MIGVSRNISRSARPMPQRELSRSKASGSAQEESPARRLAISIPAYLSLSIYPCAPARDRHARAARPVQQSGEAPAVPPSPRYGTLRCGAGHATLTGRDGL